jgi:glycosyltransferase involved in cell wall biosynthesis
MRIVLTVHQFLPDFRAGTEILTCDTAKALMARGHEVSVFTGFPARRDLADAQRFDRYHHDGIAVERFHHNYAPMGGETTIAALEYNNPLFAAYFRDYLTRMKPDVAHFFHLQRLSASAIDVCAELGIPMVLTPTDFWLVCPTNQLLLPDHALCSGPDAAGVNCLRHVVARTQSGVAKACLSMLPDSMVAALIGAISRGLFRRQALACEVRALAARRTFIKSRVERISRIAVPTRLMADVLAKNGFDRTRMRLLPFGISSGPWSRKAPTSTAPKLRAGFIGTLIEHKGAHVLVEAVRTLDPEVPIEVSVYGDPGEFPQYAARLRRIAGNDPRITFCGTFPNDRLGEVFSSLDVLVVPSIWYENTPLIIYSAQAWHCPVIASDLAGVSEVVTHEGNGLLFERGKASELAHALRRVATDRSLLRRLTEQAKPPKSSAEYAAELEEVYREVVAERRAA